MLTMILSIFVFLIFLFLIKYIWERRWIYYYGSKFPGPSGIPLLVPFELITANTANIYERILSTCKSQPPVFKLFLTNQLIIINCQPEDLDVLLNTYIDKPPSYEVVDQILKDSLLTAPGKVWKSKRKTIGRMFNPKILASFHEIFVKNSKRMVTVFNQVCGKETSDAFILDNIWKFTLDISIETLGGIDPSVLPDVFQNIKYVVRGEEISAERMLKFWLMNPIIWHFSQLRQEVLFLKKTFIRQGEKIIAEAKKVLDHKNNDDSDNKRFLFYLLHLNNTDAEEKIPQDQLPVEIAIMLMAASETTAVALLWTILVLGLFPEFQDQIYQEIASQWGTSDGGLSPENVNQLVYLERVIKETLRLFPPVPIISRSVDKTIKLDQYTYPAGSALMVIISHLHRRPDLWPDPLKFDPDRFLPENVTKRHRCAFIPFSHGLRNCIGFQYGMRSTKIMLAYIVKNFHIKAVNYHSLEDIEVEFHMMLVPKNCRVVFEKRKI